MNKYLVIKLKSVIIPYCALFLLIIFVMSPATSFKGASRGLELWLYTVVPSQLPFFILTGYLLKTNIIKSLEYFFSGLMYKLFKLPGCSSFALLSGIIGGYPLGAKTVVTLRLNKNISKNEAEQLLMFTSFSSPLFITAAVATSILGHPDKSALLLLCHIVSGLLVGFFSRVIYSEKKTHLYKNVKNIMNDSQGTITSVKNEVKKHSPIGKILADCVIDSFQTLFLVGGFIIFFAVIIEYLNRTNTIDIISNVLITLPFLGTDLYWQIKALIGGFFEITNGISHLSILSQTIKINQLMSVTAFLAAWGGLSVHLQVASILSTSDLSVKPYLLGKTLHAIFAGIITYLIFTFI